MIHLAIAEDHQSLIDGIKLMLQYEEDFTVVGTANNGEDLLKIVDLKRPDTILMDIKMPKLDGIEATKIIKQKYPHINVLAFTMFDDLEAVEKMIQAGAKGYILKNSSLEIVLQAIKTVAKGEEYFDAGLNHNALDKKNKSKQKSLLTNRQIEIIDLIAQGKTSREIAEQLFIGVQTVETHRKNIIRVLGLKGKGELLRYSLDRKYKFSN
jgi:two-component system nitrate/nitrite response regulator NarL